MFFFLHMQTEPTNDAVVDIVSEIKDIIKNSSGTVQDLMKIAGLLDNLSDILSTDIPIRNEVSTPTLV